MSKFENFRHCDDCGKDNAGGDVGLSVKEVGILIGCNYRYYWLEILN